MRLTTLEIKGFKSFGDKVTIHFDKGVTSIVGPNGSGKSNVVDAMRWVLGEQKTRMLRSEKMENIIFNGSKTRKPSNLAEVSLSFENTKNVLPTEYSVVTITRKLYRTGESEYLLNNIPCRLKDITDLFLDTGIGSDSYSIIELKMIDEIINDKNNTIKLLFEEAAGISKYKIRKKQTFQKLEETEADLNRVNDLLYEIEKNLKTLEVQAKKSERYYKIKEDYKNLSTQLAVFSIHSFKSLFDELQQQEEKKNTEKLQIETQITKIEADIQRQKLDNLQKEKELSSVQKIYTDKVNVINQFENDKKIKNERLKFLQDKEKGFVEQIAASNNNLQELKESIKHQETEKENEQHQLATIELLVKELNEKLENIRKAHHAVELELNQLTKDEQDTQLEIHQFEKNYAIKQTQRDSFLQEIERINKENENKLTEIEDVGKQFVTSKQEKEKKENAIQELHIKQEEFLALLSKTEEELKKNNDHLIEENRKLDAKQNEYNLTKSLIDNLEGFPESIKFLKKNASYIMNAPLLSDILSCKAEFKIAIESFVEPFMSYFIVENLNEAHQAINLLSEASKGRANFFILDEFRNDAPEVVKDIPNCIHALQLIEVERNYQQLCNYLLKNVYIVLDEHDNNILSSASEYASCTFISQSGKYCKTKHSLSGGSVGLFDGKRIGRIKNLELLDKEIKKMESSRIILKSHLEKLHTELVKLKEEQHSILVQDKELHNMLSKANAECSSLQDKKEYLENTANNARKRLDEIESQLKSIDENEILQSGKFEEFLSEHKAKHQQLSEKKQQVQHDYKKLTDELNEQSQAYNQQNIIFLQQQNKINTLLRELGYKKTQVEELNKAIENNSADLSNSRSQIQEIVGNSTDFDSQLISMYQEKEQLEKNIAQAETEYFSLRGKIDEFENQVKELRRNKDAADAVCQSIKERITEIKIQQNGLKERLNVEFNIEIEDVSKQELPENINEEELKEKVEKIKNQLNNYGPINPMAIEAYNEIKERHTFIIGQKEDLIKAKESLLQTIGEIDTSAKEKFLEAFQKIRENFINVFRSLFSEEDKCDLILADANSPLEADIQIIAQPKGKKPLSINQLSGGEKTLTATALLFGIYLLKPAPFCVFDEVDAPLDDNNIDKFNNIIKNFSEDSQFIIITHNKKTMAATEIIYGITMIEQGVTQVVPVDLREADAYAN